MILKINKFQAWTRKLDQRYENKYTACAAIYHQGIKENEISKLKNETYWEIEIIRLIPREK